MKMEEQDYEKKYEEIVKSKVLELFKNTDAGIFLFGSRARGDYKRDSDYDIGIESIDYGLAQKLLGILSAKCPVFTGLLRIDYAKLFLYDPYDTFRRFKIKSDEFWDESIVPYKVDFVYFDTTKPGFKKEAKQYENAQVVSMGDQRHRLEKPKQVIKEAYNQEVFSVQEYEHVMGMLDDRNRLSNVYEKEQFEEIYLRIMNAFPTLIKALEYLRHEIKPSK
jgi:predicted nucleotidyltransferase